MYENYNLRAYQFNELRTAPPRELVPPLAINRVPAGSHQDDDQPPKGQLRSGPTCRIASLQTAVATAPARRDDERLPRGDVVHQRYQIFIVATIAAGANAAVQVAAAAAAVATIDAVRMVHG